MYTIQRIGQQTTDNKENLKFIIYYNSMDYELELKNEKLESMIHVYEEHIDVLEKENKSLKLQVEFLKQQLEYKTFGKPLDLEEEEWVAT